MNNTATRSYCLLQKYLSAFLVIFLLSFLFSPKAYSEKLKLPKKKLIERIQTFYPINKIKGSKFDSIKSLSKRKRFDKALKQAEIIYKNSPGDHIAGYCYQAVKSYSLVSGAKILWEILLTMNIRNILKQFRLIPEQIME